MKLVFTTNNLNKLKEVQLLLPPHIQLLSLKEIGCEEEIPETQSTIEGNAVQKASYIKNNYNYDCFADDTGLEVEALGGAPGVYSARYAGENSSSEKNISKLLKALKPYSNKAAQFKTVIALSIKDDLKTFTGICKGHIIASAKGNQGFGYDPIFKPLGYTQTFSEMPLEQKNSISHRAKAIQLLNNHLNHSQ